MAHNGHPNMQSLGIQGGHGGMGGRHHLMDLSEQPTLHTDQLVQDNSVKKAATKAKDAVKKAAKDTKHAVQNKAKSASAKAPHASTSGAKTLDDLIKEYGMEAEAEMINTGSWGVPYADYLAAGTYEEVPAFEPTYPYFDLMDLSFQGGQQSNQGSSNTGYNMQNMNFQQPNQGNGNMGPTFGLQQMNNMNSFGQNNQMGGNFGM